MPLKKILFKPGVNQENTRYTNEGGWYSCDKIRFRQGMPEKIGGWAQISPNTFLGTCRSLWPWRTLANTTLIGNGTNLKYYLTFDAAYYDITPIRTTVTLGANPFATSYPTNTTTVTVTHTAHGCITGDFVTFSGATAVGGISAVTLNQEYQVTVLGANTYTITVATGATSAATGGGSAVSAAYQINTGSAIAIPVTGYGAGSWGEGTWGTGQVTTKLLRIWNNQNFGENLIFGPQGGALYIWKASYTIFGRGTLLSAEAGASDVPLMHNLLLVSDTSRFVLAFGVNDYGSVIQNPMLIRWSDQENAINWTPSATNQAGSLTLSHGSIILAAFQIRQEIFVLTDTSAYSLQYLGAPAVWGSQPLSDNISVVSASSLVFASGVAYWMGFDKFYYYDGRVQSMPCDLRQYVFEDFNAAQAQQVFATTVEKFTEVWWFYCSANSNDIDRYVVYNYIEKIWYYGTMSRTAMVDSSIASNYPIAAAGQRLVYQEYGLDDNLTGTPVGINAYITSSEFDIEDGHNFGFVWRVLPDITFRGSTTENPQATLTLLPLQNSGSGYNNPQSVAGSSSGAVIRSAVVPVEKFTGQVNIRIRGRQMSLKVESANLGVQWQLGAPRIDIRPDGRR